MTTSALILAASFTLFLIGLQLSAFFSGSETGYYRVSQLQLALQRQQGDPAARSLCHFIDHPERFVSTTLVGNNVANYLTTLAIGVFVAQLAGPDAPLGTIEIMSTLMLTPVVFIFGELIPKSLYYRAPLSLLRKRIALFQAFYYLFLPISIPLTLAAGTMFRVARKPGRRIDLLFGRTRLFGLIEAGKRDGIISRIQGRLADNLMRSSSRSLRRLMASPNTIASISASADRDAMLRAARRSEAGRVFLDPKDGSRYWTRCVRVATLLLSHQSVKQVSEPVLQFDVDTVPLLALVELYREHAWYGTVIEDNKVIGVVRRDQLAEQLLMYQPSGGVRTAWEL